MINREKLFIRNGELKLVENFLDILNRIFKEI